VAVSHLDAQYLEWQTYLDALPQRLPREDVASLEAAFHLSTARNPEIRITFLVIAAHSGYEPLFPAIRESLMTLGKLTRRQRVPPGYYGAC
jgi:hypothetical protein